MAEPDLLCAVVAACGLPVGHDDDHGDWRTLTPSPSRLRGDTLGHALSPREMEVMLTYARNPNVKDVAELLGLSPLTVKTHVTHIFAKLGVHSWAGAMYVHGWIRIPTDRELAIDDFERRFEDMIAEVAALADEAREIAAGLDSMALDVPKLLK